MVDRMRSERDVKHVMLAGTTPRKEVAEFVVYRLVVYECEMSLDALPPCSKKIRIFRLGMIRHIGAKRRTKYKPDGVLLLL